MSERGQKFISDFHNLPGKSVKKKHINLYLLLRENLSLKDDKKELDFISSNLKPIDHLEKIFFVDFLIYFQRFNELYENIKNGDDITISKLSKKKWFFQQVCENKNATEFVSTVLPTLSYSMKKKILHKLTVEEKKADEIFDALKKQYGISFATDFLPKCTKNKIRNSLTNNPNKLTQRQLQSLYNKDPSLIYVYFEERYQDEETSSFLQDYDNILIYIAQKNPEMFTNLFEKYKIRTQLGRRTTKKFLTHQKTKVIDRLEDYASILNNSVIVRKLGDESKKIFFKTSRETHEPYWNSLIKHYPKNQQFNIYRASFNAVHHEKLETNVDAISEDIIVLISDRKERERFAQLRFEKDSNEVYLKYILPESYFEEYEERINSMRFNERAKFVQVATECCVIDKNLKGLLKMCELVAVTFENDERRIRDLFFRALHTDITFTDKFTAQHWNYISKMFDTADKNSEWISNEQEFRIKYIKFLIRNNQSLTDMISRYFDDWPDALLTFQVYKDRPLFKPIVNELLSETLQVNRVQYSSSKNDCTLAYVCKLYNERNPRDIIPIYDSPKILTSVMELLKNEESGVEPCCKLGVEYIICRESSSAEIEAMKNLYFQKFETFGGTSGLMWFLKYEPATLYNNLKHFLELYEDGSVLQPKSLWRYIKKYSFLKIDKHILEFCKAKITEGGSEQIADFVTVLSILDSPDSYLRFIQPFAPLSDKVDWTDVEATKLFPIQASLSRFMHLINCPQKILRMVIGFCKGDYLKYALSSLYSCMYKLSESETKSFLKNLSDIKSYSVKKHVVYLSCILYDVDTVQNCLKRTVSTASLRTALKYFAKNPSESQWKLVQGKFVYLKLKDFYLCEPILEMTAPLEYRGKYIEILWKLLESYEQHELQINLMKRINKHTIKHFDPNFAFEIIRNCSFQSKEGDDLVATLLVYLNNDKKITIFSELLTDLKKNEWNKSENIREVRQKLNRFICIIFETYIKVKKKDEMFETQISTTFKSIFSLSEAFKETVVVSLMAFNNQSTEKCSTILLELNDEIGKSYTSHVLALFADTVKNYVFRQVFTTDSDRIEICYSLLKKRKSNDHDLLILMLMPKTIPADMQHFVIYDEILEALRKSKDPVVELQFNLYLKSQM